MTLPYQFDTSTIPKAVIRGIAWLSLITIGGILYSAVFSHDFAVAVVLLIVTSIIAYFARLFLRYFSASTGTITATAISLQPCRVLGVQLPGPTGNFSIQHFSAVRVEHVFGGMDESTPLLEFARVTLIGKAETPDILIARVDFPLAQTLGKSLCSKFGFLYEEKLRPY